MPSAISESGRSGGAQTGRETFCRRNPGRGGGAGREAFDLCLAATAASATAASATAAEANETTPGRQLLKGLNSLTPFVAQHPGGIGAHVGGIALVGSELIFGAFDVGQPIPGLLAKQILLAEAVGAPVGAVEDRPLLAQVIGEGDLLRAGRLQGLPEAWGGAGAGEGRAGRSRRGRCQRLGGRRGLDWACRGGWAAGPPWVGQAQQRQQRHHQQGTSGPDQWAHDGAGATEHWLKSRQVACVRPSAPWLPPAWPPETETMQPQGPRLMSVNGYRDYFKVLGVERGADADTIKRSFRKLARQYHPDVNPDDQGAEARFKEISEAYEVLSDPDKRRRYEQFGQYWNQMGSPSAGAGADVDFGRYGNFDDFVNDLLGRFGGAPGGFGSGFPGGFPGPGAGGRSAPIDLDAEASINLPLGDAFRGCERTLAVNEERVQVRIPAGVKDGSRLRLKGKGNLQPGTGRRGDLYLTLKLQPHPVWRLDGDQLRAELPLSLDELALGGEVRVATPDGEATVQVPPGMSLGRSLRLKGKGWPLKEGRGDLLLTPILKLPDSLSDKERQLLEDLRQARSADPRQGWIAAARL